MQQFHRRGASEFSQNAITRVLRFSFGEFLVRNFTAWRSLRGASQRVQAMDLTQTAEARIIPPIPPADPRRSWDLGGSDQRIGGPTMCVRIDAGTDFSCPYCFLATLTLNKLRKETDMEVHWMSFELQPPGAPPMPPEERMMAAEERKRARELARAQFGIELIPGPIGIGMRNAHLAFKYADAHGSGDAFHFAAMRAYWMEGRSIDDKEVLKDIARSVGLKMAGLATAWSDLQFAEAIDFDRQQAELRGIRAVPTLIFSNEHVVSGAQPYEAIRKIAERFESLYESLHPYTTENHQYNMPNH